MRRLQLLFATLLLTVLHACAQSPIRNLQAFIGTWTGKAEFTDKRPPFTAPVDCQMQVTPSLHGHYFHCAMTLLVPGQPDEKLMLLTYSPNDRLFESWTFNEDNPGANFMTGILENVIVENGKDKPFDPATDKPDAKKKLVTLLTMSGYPQKAQGETIALRQAYRFVDRDHFFLTYSIRRKDTWYPVYTASYERKK
jgi:hypothetical protein